MPSGVRVVIVKIARVRLDELVEALDGHVDCRGQRDRRLPARSPARRTRRGSRARSGRGGSYRRPGRGRKGRAGVPPRSRKPGLKAAQAEQNNVAPVVDGKRSHRPSPNVIARHTAPACQRDTCNASRSWRTPKSGRTAAHRLPSRTPLHRCSIACVPSHPQTPRCSYTDSCSATLSHSDTSARPREGTVSVKNERRMRMAYGIVHHFPGGTKEQDRDDTRGGASRQSQPAPRPDLPRGWRVGWWLDGRGDSRFQGKLGAVPRRRSDAPNAAGHQGWIHNPAGGDNL